MHRRVAVTALCAVVLAVPATTEASRPPGTKACGLVKGSQNELTFRVYAKRVTCTTARAVFRRTVEGKVDRRGWSCVQHVFADGERGTRCVGRGLRRVYGLPTTAGGD